MVLYKVTWKESESKVVLVRVLSGVLFEEEEEVAHTHTHTHTQNPSSEIQAWGRMAGLYDVTIRGLRIV